MVLGGQGRGRPDRVGHEFELSAHRPDDLANDHLPSSTDHIRSVSQPCACYILQTKDYLALLPVLVALSVSGRSC